MKVKPFDLHKALAGHPVVTRNGRKIIRIAHFPEATMYPVSALIDGEDRAFTFTESGKYHRLSNGDGNLDLSLEVTSAKRWARITRCIHDGRMACSFGHLSKQSADAPDGVFSYVLPAYEYEVEE